MSDGPRITLADANRLIEHLRQFQAPERRASDSHPLTPAMLAMHIAVMGKTGSGKNKGLHNAGRHGSEGKEAPELLIVNGPSFTGAEA
jgi:hypothetical protein